MSIADIAKLLASLSPDGRWIAYHSNESGRNEVYARPFPDVSGKWPISSAGGSHSVWARRGRELFYRSNKEMMEMMGDDGDDGRRFLMIKEELVQRRTARAPRRPQPVPRVEASRTGALIGRIR